MYFDLCLNNNHKLEEYLRKSLGSKTLGYSVNKIFGCYYILLIVNQKFNSKYKLSFWNFGVDFDSVYYKYKTYYGKTSMTSPILRFSILYYILSYYAPPNWNW